MPIVFTPQPLNLASAALGAEAIAASDEFFGARDRLLSDAAPVFIPGKYDENGKWMDGWESRRKRGPGHDWCVVRLATPAHLSALEIDTSHFTGNYPAAASVEAVNLPAGQDPDGAPENLQWAPLLPASPLDGNSQARFDLPPSGPWTHLRLSIYPDGGVARLRAYGTVASPPLAAADGLCDLVAALGGGRVIACNDAHFGQPGNVLLPGLGARMEDGWETRRRREPGHDWLIIALAQPGIIERAEVMTQNFKGNAPAACSLHGAWAPTMADQATVPQSMFWPELLPITPLGANQSHSFTLTGPATAVTHVRFSIHPDGGINRLRLWGTPR
jgi:allantoicase